MKMSRSEIKFCSGIHLDAHAVNLKTYRKDNEGDAMFRERLLGAFDEQKRNEKEEAAKPEKAPTHLREPDANEVRMAALIDKAERELAALVGDIRLHNMSNTKVESQLTAEEFQAQRDKARQLSIARTEAEHAFMRLRRALMGPVNPWSNELDGGVGRR